MKKIILFIAFCASMVYSETLFEVKDASNNKVLDVSTDGLRIMNLGDTLMVISSSEIKANLSNSKGLSRSFSVSTTTSKGTGNDLMRLTGDSTRFWISDTGSGFGVTKSSVLKGVNPNLLEVSTSDTKMREGTAGEKYTDFSPENIFLGLNSGLGTDIDIANGYGVHNVFLGNGTGVLNSFGSYNVFIGKNSGYSNIGSGGGPLDGRYNVFLGYASGYSNSSGGCNVFLGDEAGYFNTTGMHNIYIGTESGRDNSSGDGNTSVGSDSFVFGDGDWNSFFGYLSGMYCNGNNNVFMGNEAGFGSDGSFNVFIGNRAGYQQSLSNRLFIDNSNTADPLIYGEFDNDSLQINGDFDVTGNSNVSGRFGVGVKPLYKIHAQDITSSNDNPAVYGKHSISDNWGVGVKGESKYIGVYGVTSNASGYGHGLYGVASGAGTGTRIGIRGTATGGDTAWAGYFDGNVYVSGSVTAASYIDVKSDHPLDPENKYLVHSSVSSDEITNIYNGNAILGKGGKVKVELPDWFESYNKDFRYQLTAIGAPGPNLYISEKIKDNSFEIAGGTENMEVSWQVVGVRNDKYSQKNPFSTVQVKKSEEKGFYIHPEAYGLSNEKSIQAGIKNQDDKW